MEDNLKEKLESLPNNSKIKKFGLKYDKETGIYYINEYHKYWLIIEGEKYRNPNFDNEYSGNILNLKKGNLKGINYYSDILIKIFNKNNINDCWVTIVPSSTKDELNLGMKKMMHNVRDNFINIKFYKCLNRIYTIDKLATGGNRSLNTHLNSIELCGSIKAYKGKKIYLIDDVTTTGNSLLACKKILEDAGAQVICIALGKTDTKDDNLEKEKVYLFDLDKQIQIILNKQDKYNIDDSLKYIFDSYKKCSDIFKKCEMKVKNKNKILERKREVYLYFINELEDYTKISGDYCSIQDINYKEVDRLIIRIFYELIYRNKDTRFVTDYFNKVRSYQKFYGIKESNYQLYINDDNICIFDDETTSQFFDIESFEDMEFDNSSSYNNIAKGLYEANTKFSLDEALKSINKAIKISPDERQLYLNRALILIKIDEYKCAFNDIEKAILLKKDSEDIVEFTKCHELILSWLKKINDLIESEKSNYIIAEFIYEFVLDEYDQYKKIPNKDEIKKYIEIANQKSNIHYKEFTKEELEKKGIENSKNKKKKTMYRTKEKIYNYKKSIIDKQLEIQIQIENADAYDYNYNDDVYPDWLGGHTTEEEFWDNI